MNTGGKEMENQPEANNMMMMFERMFQEQRAMSEIAAAVEQLVQRTGNSTERTYHAIFGTTRRKC